MGLSDSLPITTWYAVASTSAVAANVNAPAYGGIPVYNTDGQKVADDQNPLYSGILYNMPKYDQFGDYNSATTPYTGSDHYGNILDPCGASNGETMTGWDWYSYCWLDQSTVTNNNTFEKLPFYALSAPITVPVPEPSTIVLLGVGAVALIGYRWRQRREK